MKNAAVDSRVLLILRTPPPYGGGEVIGEELERLFSGTFPILAFRRTAHGKTRQGRLSTGNVLFGLRYVARSVLELVRRRPAVVYVDVPKDAFSFLRACGILVAALALRIRIVGDLAGGDFQFLGGRSPVAWLGRGVLGRMYAIRVLGATVAETLNRHGLTNAVVVSNGISEPAGAGVARPLDLATVRLLYVGAVSESKGMLILLEAMRLLVREGGMPVVLDVAGEWSSREFEERVRAAVAADGLQDRIHFHGLVVGVQKWDLFRHAHVLVHPTRWDGQPVTILESLAFGVPVVATAVGAIPDTISSGAEGYVMGDRSASEAVAGVREITRDATTYEGYSWRAREAYERRFSATVFEMGMADLLRSAAVPADSGRLEPPERRV
jgi:glycosyltransferase involved in cell wall biosynthesis